MGHPKLMTGNPNLCGGSPFSCIAPSSCVAGDVPPNALAVHFPSLGSEPCLPTANCKLKELKVPWFETMATARDTDALVAPSTLAWRRQADCRPR